MRKILDVFAIFVTFIAVLAGCAVDSESWMPFKVLMVCFIILIIYGILRKYIKF